MLRNMKRERTRLATQRIPRFDYSGVRLVDVVTMSSRTHLSLGMLSAISTVVRETWVVRVLVLERDVVCFQSLVVRYLGSVKCVICVVVSEPFRSVEQGKTRRKEPLARRKIGVRL